MRAARPSRSPAEGSTDFVPVKYRVTWVLKSFEGYGQVVAVLQVALDGLTDDLRAAAVRSAGGGVEGSDDLVGQAGGDLAHVIVLTFGDC